MNWTVRLQMEQKYSKSGYFITLTYNNEYLPKTEDGLMNLRVDDFQRFIKRLRKKVDDKLVYYAVGEYGEKSYRPHYHAIMYNLPNKTENAYKLVSRAWTEKRGKESIGIVHIGKVNIQSIQYVTGYVLKREHFKEGTLKPFTLTSKGIGIKYVDIYKNWHKEDITRMYVPLRDGKRSPLPRYWKEKIYNEMEKDAQIDYLDSLLQEKIDMDLEEYNKDPIKWEKNQLLKCKDEFEQKVQRKKQMLSRNSNNKKI